MPAGTFASLNGVCMYRSSFHRQINVSPCSLIYFARLLLLHPLRVWHILVIGRKYCVRKSVQLALLVTPVGAPHAINATRALLPVHIQVGAAS